MKKIVLIILLFSISMNAQNISKKHTIEFHSFSFSPMGAYLTKDYGDGVFGGFGGNIDLSINNNKNIVKLFIGYGDEVSLFGNINDNFVEYNLMYGREFIIKKWLSLDIFAGLGFFKFNYNQGSSNWFYKKEVIGFPIQTKIRFKTGRIFSLGLQLHNNINSTTSVYKPGLFLQWKL